MAGGTFRRLCLGLALTLLATPALVASRGILVELRQSELAGAPVAETVRLYGSSHALVIGIDNYTAGWPRLANAVKDAEAVAAELSARGFEVRLEIDLDSRALQDTLKEFFALKGADPEARLLLWFAGHGQTLNGEGFLVPADAPPANDPGFLLKALHMRDFGGLMRLANSKHVLSVFDSCFSGTIFAARAGAAPAAITRKTTQPVRQFLTSGDAGQQVRDDGSFRELFVRALRGEERADVNADGYLTGEELGLFLSQRVATLTNAAQTPRYGKLQDVKYDRGDFVFTLPGGAAGEGTATSNAAARAGIAGVDRDGVFWQSIKDSTEPADYKAYLEAFPRGAFAPLARLRASGGAKQAALVVPPKPAIELEPIEAEYRTVKNANVREQPTVDSPNVTMLRRGTRVMVVGKVKGKNWYLVERGDETLGYVFAKLLEDAQAVEPEAAEPGTKEPSRSTASTTTAALEAAPKPQEQRREPAFPMGAVQVEESEAEACLTRPTPGCVLHQALANARKVANPKNRADALQDIMVALANVGDRDGAERLSEQAVEAATSVRKQNDRFWALQSIASSLYRAGSQVAAREIYAKVIKTAAEADATEYSTRQEEEAKFLASAAQSQARVGDRDGARKNFVKAIKMAKKLDGVGTDSDSEKRASVLTSIAEQQIGADEKQMAMQTLKIALKYARKIKGDDRDSAYSAIATQLASAGDKSQALRLVEDIEDANWRVLSLGYIAVAQSKEGDSNGAHNILEKAKLEVERDKSYLQALGRTWLAEAQSRAGFIAEAQATLSKIPATDNRDSVQNEIAKAHASMGDIVAARRTATKIITDFQRDSAFDSIAGKLIEDEDLNQALEIIRLISDSDYSKWSKQSLTVAYVRSGQKKRAIEMAKSIDDEEYRDQALAQAARETAKQGDIMGILRMVRATEGRSYGRAKALSYLLTALVNPTALADKE